MRFSCHIVIMPFSEDIDRFSQEFKDIMSSVKDIVSKRELVNKKLAHLKVQYNDMVKTNTKKIFMFCLDSFFYQYKMYSAELEQIESSRVMVNNRMYCEYYKLYGIITAYLKEINLSYENKVAFLKQTPAYKHLEPTLEYDLNDTESIYDNVVLLITHLNEKMCKNTAEIEGYNVGNKLGFSISNFVNTLRNENLILQGQIDLFMNYLSFFLNSQKKQYDRIDARMTDFLEEMGKGAGNEDGGGIDAFKGESNQLSSSRNEAREGGVSGTYSEVASPELVEPYEIYVIEEKDEPKKPDVQLASEEYDMAFE